MKRALAAPVVAVVLTAIAVAAEPTTRPRSMPDVSKMDAETLRLTIKQLSFRIDALEDELSSLKQQARAPQGAASGATTQPSTNSWVVTVTSVVAQDTFSAEQELMTQQIRLSGGQGGRTDSSASFSQYSNPSSVRAQSEYSRNADQDRINPITPGANGASGGGPNRTFVQTDQRSNFQQNQRPNGQSASMGPGSSASYHDVSVEEHLARERDKLTSMDDAWDTRTDSNGNRSRVNRYSRDEVTRQRAVVTQLESERTRIQQRIGQLQRDLEKARNTTVITGTTEEGQAITVTASQLVSAVARTLAAGEKVRVDGVATRRAPSLEVTARTVVPLR